jgi:hypothetical protein
MEGFEHAHMGDAVPHPSGEGQADLELLLGDGFSLDSVSGLRIPQME